MNRKISATEAQLTAEVKKWCDRSLHLEKILTIAEAALKNEWAGSGSEAGRFWDAVRGLKKEGRP